QVNRVTAIGIGMFVVRERCLIRDPAYAKASETDAATLVRGDDSCLVGHMIRVALQDPGAGGLDLGDQLGGSEKNRVSSHHRGTGMVRPPAFFHIRSGAME